MLAVGQPNSSQKDDLANEKVLAEQTFCFIYAVAASLFSDDLRISNFVIV